jgi:hypothetical protein
LPERAEDMKVELPPLGNALNFVLKTDDSARYVAGSYLDVGPVSDALLFTQAERLLQFEILFTTRRNMIMNRKRGGIMQDSAGRVYKIAVERAIPKLWALIEESNDSRFAICELFNQF